MHDNAAASRSGTTIDLRAQVLETIGQGAAVAKLADCVFHEPLGVLLLTKDNDLARCLAPGRWVHAAGRPHFCFPSLVCALEMTSCELIADQEWGGAEYVGHEEMLMPHLISTQARVMTPWRPYDVSDDDGYRRYGYTADVALAEGRDGTRAVLHWSQGAGRCCFRREPPAMEVGDLVAVQADLTWYPYQLGRPLPPRTPILGVSDLSDIAVVHDAVG